MAFLTSLKYMCTLQYNNLMTAAHTWATTNLTVLTGHGTALLDDDDAVSAFKATKSTSSDATIAVTFSQAQNISAFGICNHNIRTGTGCQYMYLEYHNGSTWVNLDDPGKDPYVIGASGYTDRDAIVLFDAQNRTQFRMRFVGMGDTLSFQIGYVYWGNYHQWERNPSSFRQTRAPATRYIQSAGGMSHAIKGMRYRIATLEMEFVRAKAADIISIQQTGLTDGIVGVLPPEYAAKPENAPRANDVFWGRYEEMELDPQTPSNIVEQNEVYNTVIKMNGAV